jgi:hypothetical protein
MRIGKILDSREYYDGKYCVTVHMAFYWSPQAVLKQALPDEADRRDASVRVVKNPKALAHVRALLAELSDVERQEVFSGLGAYCPHCGRDELPCNCTRDD